MFLSFRFFSGFARNINAFVVVVVPLKVTLISETLKALLTHKLMCLINFQGLGKSCQGLDTIAFLVVVIPKAVVVAVAVARTSSSSGSAAVSLEVGRHHLELESHSDC